MRERWRKGGDCLPGAFVQALVVTKLREPQKIERGDGTCRWFGAVIVILHSENNAFVFAIGREVAAVFLIVEQTVLRFLQLNRKFQPLDVERRLVKIEKSSNDECVIVGKAFDIAATFAIIAKQQ